MERVFEALGRGFEVARKKRECWGWNVSVYDN